MLRRRFSNVLQVLQTNSTLAIIGIIKEKYNRKKYNQRCDSQQWIRCLKQLVMSIYNLKQLVMPIAQA